MLQRIYIDNYKCCVNFDVKFNSINLLLGDNGAGKSTVFDTLRKIQALLGEGREVMDLFPIDSLTRWQTKDKQHFEVELSGNGGEYRYELVVDHNRSKQLSRIHTERLWFNNKPLINFEGGNAQLYRDNYSEGPNYPFDWNRSAIGSLPSRDDNTKLTWFKNRFRRMLIIHINPMSIESQSEKESDLLDVQCRNFVSWYRFVSQNQGKAFEITNALKKVIDGFHYFEFETAGENQRLLKVRIAKQTYRFDELSDGQRALIVLYAVIHFTQGQDYTLYIDEAENFVSLPEIQPWLSQLYDFAIDNDLQALLISHHPELINYLASSAGILFERDGDTPIRISYVDVESGLPMSELVARGWIHESA